MQMREAKRGKATEQMKEISKAEGVSTDKIIKRVASGEVVIPKNKTREDVMPLGIGKGLRTKVNANIGTSPDYSDADEEAKKAKVAVEYGTDTLMDLSIGGDIEEVRRRILSEIDVPLGTVPIYQAAIEAADEKDVVDMSSDDIFNAVRKHAEDGVDFVTVHCGVTKDTVESLRERGRL